MKKMHWFRSTPGVFALWIIITISSFGLIFAVARPNSASTASAIAIESVRDVNGTPTTPIRYVHGGEERIELAHLSAIEGETVEISLDADGLPTTNDSVTRSLENSGIVAACISALSLFLLAIAAHDPDYAYRREMRRRRSQDWDQRGVFR